MSGNNPNIALGTLNRIRASVTWATFPGLSVSASYLSKRGITLSFAGEATVYIDVMTGAVTSPEPYLRATFTLHLLKTQSLANSYKLQMELFSLLGQCTIRPDAATMNPWNLTNCSITGVEGLDFAGTTPEYTVRCGGIYLINSTLFT
jgi:hypothetical protein